jgi:exodeoxyribonuclease VII small subunit
VPLESTPELDAQTFEEAMAALERIVAQLEQGQLSLEQSVELFEQGVRLAKACGDRLDSAKLRVSRLEEVLGIPAIDQ